VIARLHRILAGVLVMCVLWLVLALVFGNPHPPTRGNVSLWALQVGHVPPSSRDVVPDLFCGRRDLVLPARGESLSHAGQCLAAQRAEAIQRSARTSGRSTHPSKIAGVMGLLGHSQKPGQLGGQDRIADSSYSRKFHPAGTRAMRAESAPSECPTNM
jgi:hypothetical protein